MRESFLHFLWRTRRFDAQNLLTTQNQALEILTVGEHNSNAGPDFFNARIRIAETLWAGNIEMHLKSSEWIAHGHSADPAYDNVVLHVVLEEDVLIYHGSGELIPCLTLNGRIPAQLLEHYERLEQDQAWIPCEHFFQNVPGIVRLNWLDRLMVERSEQKTTAIDSVLQATNNHWEEAFYIVLARNFGLKVNVEPFEALARSLPLVTLAKHKSNFLQIEALVLGQAGFLSGPFKEEWPTVLSREYKHLSKKYGLESLAVSQWKFLRLRPANFPTVRLAQFAGLIFNSVHLFSKVLEAKNLREFENLFECQTSSYWSNHFQLDKPTVKVDKPLGKDFIHLLVINAFVPFLFHYGKTKGIEAYQKLAFRLLEEIPPESNHIINQWMALGVPVKHAFQSQALIHLKTRYCDEKRCLECAIGNAILK